MVLKLEVGKFYHTRNGQKVGPMEARRDDGYFYDPGPSPGHYSSDGRSGFKGVEFEAYRSEWDIIAEWRDSGPVRTVTRKEIVYGVFGHVLVNETVSGGALASVEVVKVRTPSELRSAAATLIEIADALESETPA